MKKSFTLLLAFAMGLGMVANAQTFINENFTSTSGTALPAGWSQVTAATDGGFKTGTAAGLSSTYWTVPTASGRIIATNDDACDCDKSNDMMSLPVADLSAATSAYMKMDVFFFGATIAPDTEEADLMASTDNGVTWTSVYSFSGAAGWQTITVDVSQYVGNAAVTFGFRYNDNGGWLYGFAADNISLFVPAQYDVALSSNDMADYVVMGSVPVTGTVYNAGTATITTLDVSYSVDGGAPVFATLNGLNIAPLTSYTFTHPTNWNAATPGSYSIDILIDMPNGNADFDGSDNTAAKTVNVATQAVANLPLVEEFSSNTCAPCASFNATFIPLLEANNANTPSGTVAVVKYQMNWPSPGTDKSYNEDGNTRRGYYGVTGIPDAYLGGFSMGGSQGEIDAAAAEVAVMDINVDAVYAGNTVTANVTVSPYANFTAGMKLYIALVEDSYADSGTNGETNFHYIMRKMLSSGNGISLPAMTAGTPVSQTAAYGVTFGNVSQMSFNLWGADFEGMTVVAWVQNATSKKVFQSALDETLSVGIQTPDAVDFKVYPNPASNNMNIRVDMKATSELKMNVYNSVGQLVDTKAYNFNGAGVQNISYSTEALTDGLYMVQLVSGNSVSSRGVVVKH